jgi:3-hydroxybutyryl-CoA dehydratase
VTSESQGSKAQLLPSDFNDLRIGGEFVTPPHTISEADVEQFANLTGDHHPQHVDEHWAANSMFGERIVHGLLVFSCAVGLVPFDPERVVALRRLREMVFKRPVLIGEAIYVEGRVRKVTPLLPDVALVEVGLHVRREDDRLAIRAVVEAVWKIDEIQRDDAGQEVP